MDDRAPRSGPPAEGVERLASLDRLNEMFRDTTITRDRMLAELQDETHLLHCRAALALARGDEVRSHQLTLMATEVAFLASTFTGSRR
jgi:hypothetical protein